MARALSISEVEQGDLNQPIWALNGSADSSVGQKGDVVVGVPKLNGSKVDALKLPQTWLPVCLTDQIPRAQLLASSEFRTAVGRKLIRLIPEEYAKQLKEQDGAEEEQDRLDAFEREIRQATATRAIQSDNVSVISTSELEDTMEEAPDPHALSANFLMFAEHLEPKNDIDSLNAVRNRGSFKPQELRHLLKAVSDKPKTGDFVKRLLG